jgi:hypothetical protein
MSEPASSTPSGPGPRPGAGDPASPATRPPSEWSHGTRSELAAPSFPGPAPPPTFPGYEVLRELGHGGMGVVYLARDQKRGRPVALKTVQWLDPAALYRFKQEFRLLADRAHANLVTLYELYADGRLCFFTMELLDGVHFLAHVRGGAAPPEGDDYRLPPEGLARLRAALRQLGDGLAALHRANVLHRDVKPANVLVTREGRVVLLDFGLATSELDAAGEHQSAQPRLLGTAAYMAPEQAAGRPVSAASDWYAVGVILYEALTGRLPYTGALTEVLLAKQQHDPPRPRDLAPDVPDDLDALCMDLLRRNPEERPSEAEVLRRLGAAAGPAAAAAAPSPAGSDVPLVGRERHLQALHEAFEPVRQGQAVTVCVHGRSGVGKSALLRCFLQGLSEGGRAVVLAGRCYEQESVPYKALDSVVDALSRYLERLPRLEAQALLPRDMGPLTRVFPVLGRVEAVARAPGRAPDISDPKEVRRRGLVAMRELVARLADRHPLVVAIDDLQWGDVDSAALLTELMRPPEAPALLLVVSYRSEDAATSPCLRHLLRPPEPGDGADRRELAVEPLPPEEGEELALALLPAGADRTLAAALAREARGNPFFLYELAQHAQAGPLPAHGADTGVSLQEVLWARVLGLPEGDRRLLEAVAVASQPLREADACAAAEVAADGPQALARLRAARFLRTAGPAEREEVETYHDRIRETVTARLTPEARAGHHRRLAATLEAAGQADPEVLAVHFLGGGDARRAGHYYARAAAQAAEALAFDRAANLYGLALEHAGAKGEDRRRLLALRGDALANAGRGAEAARTYLEAAAGAASGESLELQRRAALQFLTSGHVDDGLAALRRVLAEVGLRPPGSPRRAFWGLVWQRLRLRLRGLGYRARPEAEVPAEELARLDACRAAAVGLSMVNPIEGSYFQSRSLRLALAAGEPRRLASALTWEAAHESVGGTASRKRVAHLLAAAEPLVRELADPYLVGLVALARGLAAALEGNWPEGCAQCDRGAEALRTTCRGVLWELGTAHRFALWPLMFMGEVREIERRLPTLVKEAEDRDDLYEVTNLCLVIRTFLRLAADQPGRARQELEGVMARWSQQGFHVQHMNRLHDETQLDLYEGQRERAWRRLTEAWPLLARSHLLLVEQVRIFLLHLRARAALAAAAGPGGAGPYLRAAAADARRLGRERAAWAQALGRLIEAGVAHGRQDAAGAARLLEDAAARLDAVAMRLYAAAARRRLGRLRGAAGKGLADEAEAWMRSQKVANPARMTALLAPGFPDE